MSTEIVKDLHNDFFSQINSSSVKKLIDHVLEAGEFDVSDYEQKSVLLWKYPSLKVFGLLNPQDEEQTTTEDLCNIYLFNKQLGRYLPDHIYLKSYNAHSLSRVLEVGFSRQKGVNIEWSYNLNKPIRYESVPSRHFNLAGQWWKQYSHSESLWLLNEDPWVSGVDTHLLARMDQFTDWSPRRNLRGNIVYLSYRPNEDKALNLLYHFDIHGETNSFRWLSYRTLDIPGQVIRTVYNTRLPNPDDKVQVEIPEVGMFQFNSYVTTDELTRNILLPSHDERGYNNYWQITPCLA